MQVPNTIMHTLRNCDVIKDLCDNFITMNIDNLSTFFNLVLLQWVNLNLQLFSVDTNQCNLCILWYHEEFVVVRYKPTSFFRIFYDHKNFFSNL